MKPKVGDIVRLKPISVKIVLKDDTFGGSFVAAADRELSLHGFSFDMIEEILPRPLAVDDKIRFYDSDNSKLSGVIMAIDGDCAWVKFGADTRSTQLLSTLRRVDT